MNQFEENAYEVPGVITDIKEHYDSDDKVSHDVYVKFWYDGEKYEGRRISVTALICMLVKKSHYSTTPAYPTRLDVKRSKSTGCLEFYAGWELFSVCRQCLPGDYDYKEH